MPSRYGSCMARTRASVSSFTEEPLEESKMNFKKLLYDWQVVKISWENLNSEEEGSCLMRLWCRRNIKTIKDHIKDGREGLLFITPIFPKMKPKRDGRVLLWKTFFPEIAGVGHNMIRPLQDRGKVGWSLSEEQILPKICFNGVWLNAGKCTRIWRSEASVFRDRLSQQRRVCGANSGEKQLVTTTAKSNRRLYCRGEKDSCKAPDGYTDSLSPKPTAVFMWFGKITGTDKRMLQLTIVSKCH